MIITLGFIDPKNDLFLYDYTLFRILNISLTKLMWYNKRINHLRKLSPEKHIQNFGWKTSQEKSAYRSQRVNRSMIRNHILEKRGM
jgi:hypothetical protein